MTTLSPKQLQNIAGAALFSDEPHPEPRKNEPWEEGSSVWVDTGGAPPIRAGVGLLLLHTPMSPERREAFQREEEREQRQAELEAEQRRADALDRREGLLFQGETQHTHAEVLARLSSGADHEDRIEARREKDGAEARGEHEPRRTIWEMKADQAAAREHAASTAASQADLTKLAGKINSLANSVNLLKRRR